MSNVAVATAPIPDVKSPGPQGLLVTLAIGLHNIPEGLAVATVLVAKGISARRAFWWTLFTSGLPAERFNAAARPA